jgi:L-asparaginase II
VVTAAGDVLYRLGDVHRPYPVRSLAKPFLTAELVKSGAADAFGLTAIDLAIAAGSHDGEEQHVDAVRAFLRRIGLSESALLCGPAIDGKRAIGAPVANNCSGKHAGVLALCKHLAFPTESYTSSDHLVQRWLLPRVMQAFGVEGDDASILIDGCGMPIFAATLAQVALAYAHFGASEEPHYFRVRAAMASHPTYVGGALHNLDTEVIRNTDGAVIGKIGAEGMHGDAIASNAIGIAIKVIDGNSRALGPALVALLRRFVALPLAFSWRLETIASQPVLNASNTPVGIIRAVELP